MNKGAALKRSFTPEEASRTLPLVRRVVSDILETGRQLRARTALVLETPEQDPDCRRLGGRLKELLQELESVGCTYKDWSFTEGLVDFPARMDGQDVLLCWRSDESNIRYYHGLHDGYAGRKPIPESYFSTVE